MNELEQIRARAEAATKGPWFLSDCEGDVIVLPESDLVCVSRDETGRITSWGLPTSYRPERRILEVELDSWDEGEDEQDDQVRANAEFIAHARTDVPRLLAALAAVMALHVQDDEGDCTHCAEYFCDTRKAEFPCRTVLALTKAMEGKP